MNPLSWAELLPIVIRHGIPAAERLWTLFKNKEEVTEAHWEELRQLSKKTYDDYIAEAQARAGK